jgi:hypothetical protein
MTDFPGNISVPSIRIVCVIIYYVNSLSLRGYMGGSYWNCTHLPRIPEDKGSNQDLLTYWPDLGFRNFRQFNNLSTSLVKNFCF